MRTMTKPYDERDRSPVTLKYGTMDIIIAQKE